MKRSCGGFTAKYVSRNRYCQNKLSSQYGFGILLLNFILSYTSSETEINEQYVI